MLQLKSIRKTFPGLVALDNIDFDLAAGEVHALLGENGAGKSTLIKVMTGAYKRDSGEIYLEDKNISPSNPAQAQAAGISTVYQEVNLCPNLSVAHNLYLGREPKKFACINWKKIHRDATALLSRFNLNIDSRKNLADFPIAIQQLVAIARGVDCSAKVLILDEPTASLDASEVDTLFNILTQLKEEGMGIIFVTHFLDQVYRISDRITILRNGKKINTFLSKQLSREKLIENMLGKELPSIEEGKSAPKGSRPSSQNNFLKLKNVSVNHSIENLSFDLQQGQALGLAGLLGSGRTEICKTLFGIDQIASGTFTLNDEPVSFSSPAQAIKKGLALCPEDRKTAGIIGPLSIRENIILALQARQGWWKPLAKSTQNELSLKALKNLNIVTSGIEKPIELLSGGNQQKVILARWLATQPRLLILDEPTRGIDIGAHAEIIKLILSLCEQGMALVVATSELEELVSISHKALVLRDRKIVCQLSSSEISEDNILRSIASGRE